MSERPLDDLFDCLAHCAAVLEDYAHGALTEAAALERIRFELRGVGSPDAPIGWLELAPSQQWSKSGRTPYWSAEKGTFTRTAS